MNAPPDRARVQARCAKALGAQSFVAEQDIAGKTIIGGRWGGVLQSDWDSAIHVLLELVMDRPAGQAGSAIGVRELVRHVLSVLTRDGVPLRALDPTIKEPPPEFGDADTLRINYLAVMALLRTAATSASQWPGLAVLADECWNALAPKPLRWRVQPAWSDLPTASAFLRRVCEDLTHTDQHARRRSALSYASTAERDRLIQELQAFVLLAALPGKVASVSGPGGMQLQRDKRALYEQLTGSDPSDPECCEWPPFEYFDGANILVRHLHFLASRVLEAGNVAYDASLQLSDSLFDALVPSGWAAKRLFHTLGTVAQLKDIAGAAGLVATPKRNLTSAKAATWQEFLHEARGPFEETRGIYCHLAVATGMAVTALDRYAAGRPADREKNEALAESTAQSIEALRTLRLPAQGGLGPRGLAFAPYAVFNEVVIRCWLLAEGFGAVPDQPSARQILEGIAYLLSCQDDNGLFQQRYRTNERDEGESTATGVCLRSLARFARWLDLEEKTQNDLFKGDPAAKRDFQRRLAYSITRGAEALVELQNDSGGFPTFAKTGREKMGLLGTHEGPGVQEYLLYDAPAADIVGWCLEGLCELRSEVPLVRLSDSLQRDVERAVTRAVEWLRRDFQPKAGWWGRYVGGYIGGTAMALRGLNLAGVPRSDPLVQRAAKLLSDAQRNADGGWDQDLRGDDPSFNARPEQVAMRGNATSQPELTAFAVMGLLDAGRSSSDAAVESGVRCLLTLPKGGAGRNGWETDQSVHSFMRGWNYIDQLQTDLKPVEALLRWAAS